MVVDFFTIGKVLPNDGTRFFINLVKKDGFECETKVKTMTERSVEA